MPKISIIIFILELYTQISIISNSISLPSIMDIISAVNLSSVSGLPETHQFSQSILLSENTFYIFKNLLLISSLLSLIIGTVVGLAQTKIKRLLAYSTISHIGFILLALAINTEQSVDSLIFYIIQYSLTNLNTFLIIISLGYIIKNSLPVNNLYQGTERDIKFISEFKGQFYTNPLLSICLTICLFSMAGKTQQISGVGVLAYPYFLWSSPPPPLSYGLDLPPSIAAPPSSSHFPQEA